jgi:CubicO group peptidase (beta-lactamase class C family)
MILGPPDVYPIQKAVSELQIVGFGPSNPSTPHDPDEWLRRLATLPLMHQPGENWMYNTGSYVLGVLIARASGRPLETFFRERIFEPLGMKDTGFSVPAAKLDRLASCYQGNPKPGRSSPTTVSTTASGAARAHSPTAALAWSRPSTTTWPSAR